MNDHSYTWVRALESATWRTQSRWLVRVTIENRAIWQVDRRPVEVEYGLVLGFDAEDDADYFLNVHKAARYEAPRCELVTVEPGMFVCFHKGSDALEFVRAQKAEFISEEDVMAEARRVHMAMLQQQGEAEGDPMQKVKIENKAVVPAPETKAPVQDTKKAAKGKKGK